MTRILHRSMGLLWTVATVAVALFAPRPPADNSVDALLRADSPAVAAYRRFQGRFGSDDVVVVRLEGGRGIDRLRLVETVTATLAAAPANRGVLSVTALHADLTTVLLDEIFGGPEVLAERQRELQSPVVRALGLWTSATSTPAANLYGLYTVSPPEARARLAEALEALRTDARTHGVTLRFTGPPLLNLALDRAGRQTETTALPLLLAVIVALLLVFTGGLGTTLALIAPVGLTVLAVDGIFAALGGVTNLLVDIVKPLLLVIGLASAVHVLFESRQLVARGVEPTDAPWTAARRKAVPVVMALLTTAVGFGSLGLSPVAPIQTFGRLAGAGLLMMIAAVLLVVPQALAVIARWRRRGAVGGPGTWAARAEEWIVDGAEGMVAAGLRHGRWASVIGAAAVLVGLASFFALEPEPHAIRYFAPDHPLRRDQTALERAGLGVATVEAVLGAPGLAEDPAAVPLLARFAEAGAADPAVAAVIGWPSLVEEARARAGRFEVDRPLLSALASRPAARAFAQANHARVAFLVRTVDAAELARFKRHLSATAREHLPPDWRLEITGNYDLLLTAQASLLQTLWVSLLWTAALMELALIIVLRSWRLGLVALVPNLFPVGVNLTVMALLGVPLDLGTSMTAAIALGIAVDDTLHFTLASYRTPLEVAARSAGAAIVLSSIVVGLGFAALLTAEFLPTQRFGGLCALAMVGALLADLLVLPPLLRWARGPDAH